MKKPKSIVVFEKALEGLVKDKGLQVAVTEMALWLVSYGRMSDSDKVVITGQSEQDGEQWAVVIHPTENPYKEEHDEWNREAALDPERN